MKSTISQIAQTMIILILLTSSFSLDSNANAENTITTAVSPYTVATAPSGPIKVELSIPFAPALNQPVSVTGTVSSIYDFTDLTVTISTRRRVIAPHGMDIEQPYIAGDNTTQIFNLTANHPLSFSSKIVFKETGCWSIDARASGYAPIHDRYWGDDASISLTVNFDNGVMGWTLPAPPIIPEPPPMPPPAIMPNGTSTPLEKP